MAPPGIEHPTWKKYSDYDNDLSNDATILKNLMRQQHHSRPSTQERPLTEALVWECDEHTGCRLVSPDVDRQSTSKSTNSDGRKHQKKQPFLSSENADMQQSRLSSEEDDFAAEPDSIHTLDGTEDYELLEELYRNCHNSAGNRYSHLVDCSSRDNDNQHNDHQKSYHHFLPVSEKPSTASHWSASQHIPHTTAINYRSIVQSTAGAITIILISMLLVAVLLVELIDIVCRVRKSSSHEPNAHKRKKRRLRARMNSRRLAPRYHLSGAQNEKAFAECV